MFISEVLKKLKKKKKLKCQKLNHFIMKKLDIPGFNVHFSVHFRDQDAFFLPQLLKYATSE